MNQVVHVNDQKSDNMNGKQMFIKIMLVKIAQNKDEATRKNLKTIIIEMANIMEAKGCFKEGHKEFTEEEIQRYYLDALKKVWIK